MTSLSRAKKHAFCWIASLTLLAPGARADFFGGDLMLLAEIVANTAAQLAQLRQILGTGQDTFGYLREINQGLDEALRISNTMNRTLQPGILSDLRDARAVLSAVERLYGTVPPTAESAMQQTMDVSVAEAIHLHNEAHRYASQLDPQAERIKSHAAVTSPQGAGRLTAESMGVLIHAVNQLLRTNAAILKLQSEGLALQNRREKLASAQFREQYTTLSKALAGFKPTYDLPSVSSQRR